MGNAPLSLLFWVLLKPDSFPKPVRLFKQFNIQISGVNYDKNKNTNHGRCRARFS